MFSICIISFILLLFLLCEIPPTFHSMLSCIKLAVILVCGYQFFSPIEDKAILENLYQHLHKTYPESEYVIDLEEKLGYDE